MGATYVKIGTDVKTGELICIGDIERRSGLYVLGKPGMGKTTLLVNMIDQDLEHGHGLFFLDPHGDAVSDLARNGCLFAAHLEDRVFLIDPETEESSFGINLLACPCVSSLTARIDTYTKAYNVFNKLWEESWGPWLQLIIENTLYAFIENQEYTLSEVPLFLTDSSFRNYLVGKMQYNLEVRDFWLREFGARREKDQEIQVQAALTRVRTLLNHQYVRDIVGQHKTTVDFSSLMERRGVLLVKLSARLAADIKKFIGTILVSELLQAARGRPQGRRHQFCVFVDEFQNFATEDFSTIINEARKFGIATTIAHQERYGQFEENRRILGATSAGANKVFFQLTVKDAQELAPEFAEKPEGTQARHEAQLVISPRAFEDIWERGHPDPVIASYRRQYFWMVDWLRLNPQQKYIEFDPAGIRTARGKEEAGRLHPECFNDWTMYRASTDMLKEGIALLNQYYYDYMMGIEIVDTAERIVKLIVLWGGVFGLRRRMVLCIPEEMRSIVLDRFEAFEWREHEKQWEGISFSQRSGHPANWRDGLPLSLSLLYTSSIFASSSCSFSSVYLFFPSGFSLSHLVFSSDARCSLCNHHYGQPEYMLFYPYSRKDYIITLCTLQIYIICYTVNYRKEEYDTHCTTTKRRANHNSRRL